MADLNLRIETGWPVPRLWPNDRSHRMAKWRSGDEAKREAYWSTMNVKRPGMKLDKTARYRLTIEAHPAVERGRDDDNLVAACKPLRDGIASALGIDDKLFDLQPVVWADKHKTGRLIFIVEPAPWSPAIIRAAVRAEVKRARRDGRALDRRYLYAETGLSWDQLERLIAGIVYQIVMEGNASEPTRRRRKSGYA